jgi:hypothetical protein
MYLYVRAAVNVSACTVTYAAQPCSAIADKPPYACRVSSMGFGDAQKAGCLADLQAFLHRLAPNRMMLIPSGGLVLSGAF